MCTGQCPRVCAPAGSGVPWRPSRGAKAREAWAAGCCGGGGRAGTFRCVRSFVQVRLACVCLSVTRAGGGRRPGGRPWLRPARETQALRLNSGVPLTGVRVFVLDTLRPSHLQLGPRLLSQCCFQPTDNPLSRCGQSPYLFHYPAP